MMLAAERKDLLVTRLRHQGKLVAKELATEFGVSEDSVRRDLRDLAAAGLCQRVHGGALPASPAIGSHAKRSGIVPESKRRVAAKAAALIPAGITVILDGGTTGLAVAAALPPDVAATVITHSPVTAAALTDHPAADVIMLGGRLHKRSSCACGAAAVEAAAGITADLFLLVVAGVHPKVGLTAGDPDEAAIRRILIGRAADTYVVASIEKLGTVAPYAVVGMSEVAGLITDAPASHPVVRQLRDEGVTVIEA
jgi:DeoR/GlpR family transcriptional regulator of sugar metabolism